MLVGRAAGTAPAAAPTATVTSPVPEAPAAADGVAAVDDGVHHRVADGDDEEDVLHVLVHLVEGHRVYEVPVEVGVEEGGRTDG